MQLNNIVKFNSILNNFEINKKSFILQSVPTSIGIGAHFFCNAKCIFCLGGNYPNFTIDRYKYFFEEKLAGVLNKTINVDFHGYGELLLMPDINKFLQYVDKTLPNQVKTFFTNGISLKNVVFPENSQYNIIVSLHASNSQLHKQIVGVDSFDEIISNIKRLQKQKNVKITLYSVLTTLNINDMENFVLLADRLKIKNVVFRYLTIFQYSHFDLSVFFIRKLANYNICKVIKLFGKQGIFIDVPKIFDNRSYMNIKCVKPWNYCYIENQGTANVCCLFNTHIGNLNEDSFDKVWNSKKYQVLRKNLSLGNPDDVCKKCINYNRNNVNKLSSHITFRPATYKKMLKYIIDNRQKYGLKMDEIV